MATRNLIHDRERIAAWAVVILSLMLVFAYLISLALPDDPVTVLGTGFGIDARIIEETSR